MRDLMNRLQRLEEAVPPVSEGLLIVRRIVSADNGKPIPGEEVWTAECQAVVLRRNPGEKEESFEARVRATFRPSPGEVQGVMLSPHREELRDA